MTNPDLPHLSHETEASQRLAALIAGAASGTVVTHITTLYRVVIDDLSLEDAEHIAKRYKNGRVESYTEVEYE